jgi:hypothetical protein
LIRIKLKAFYDRSIIPHRKFKNVLFLEVQILVQRLHRGCCHAEKIGVKQVFIFSLLLWFFAACKKENNRSEAVAIFLLKSYTRSVDASAAPAIIRYTNVSLSAAPLLADKDIAGYDPASTTFYLRKDIEPAIRDFGPDKAFAVTVNKEIIYVGEFRPAYLSSVVFGIATINPAFAQDRQLKIDYIRIDNRPGAAALDKRNDKRLLNALLKSGRLR